MLFPFVFPPSAIRFEFRSILVHLLGDINVLDNEDADSLFDVLDANRRNFDGKLDFTEFREIFRNLKRVSSIQRESSDVTAPSSSVTHKSPIKSKRGREKSGELRFK